MDVKKVVNSRRTPIFIYVEETLRNNVVRIRKATREHGLEERVRLNVPYFVNSNPHLFVILNELSVGAVLQAKEENEHFKEFGLEMHRIVSPTHLSDSDLEYFVREGIQVNVATLENLQKILDYDKEINIRVDLSPESQQRQGIRPGQFPKVKKLLGNKNLYGVHIYPGTSSELEICLRYQRRALEVLEHFPDLREINLGGGFYFDYEEKDNEKQHFNWKIYFSELRKRIDELGVGNNVRFVLEAGRDILADVGVMVVKVNNIERVFGSECYEVYTDGSYVLIPSATVKNRQHQLRFFNADFEEIKERAYDGRPARLSGNTTFSSDRLFPGIVYVPPELRAGDYVLIEDVGAYGATQHLEFLNKAPASEVLVGKNGLIKVISQSGSLTDRLRNVPARHTYSD